MKSREGEYKGRALRSMENIEIKGEIIKTSEPITLLGFMDPKTGKIAEKGHDLYGSSIEGKIFVYPRSVGSTVGSYTLVNLRKYGKEPLGIINRESDQATVAGCSVSRIPLAYKFSNNLFERIKTGDIVKLQLTAGKSEVTIV